MDLLLDLISSFDPAHPNFRPTELYNESWLVKLVLHQASSLAEEERPLGFLPESTWFSEALLPTPFRARYRGDPLAESRANADGVIGQILVGSKAKADLELRPDATQFAVVEAKVGSPLSQGITRAPDYDQAARSVACMAEIMARAGLAPSSLQRLDFVVLAPQQKIAQGTFAEQMQRASIRAKVDQRVASYGGRLDSWYSNCFEPAIASIELHSISWESVIAWIATQNRAIAEKLSDFYALCLEYN